MLKKLEGHLAKTFVTSVKDDDKHGKTLFPLHGFIFAHLHLCAQGAFPLTC